MFRVPVVAMLIVAPFTGAWIETCVKPLAANDSTVAPFTGAWIETSVSIEFLEDLNVAPFTGAWIETVVNYLREEKEKVAPFTGAWIETYHLPPLSIIFQMSRPSRARGLKLFIKNSTSRQVARRALHGRVD